MALVSAAGLALGGAMTASAQMTAVDDPSFAGSSHPAATPSVGAPSSNKDAASAGKGKGKGKGTIRDIVPALPAGPIVKAKGGVASLGNGVVITLHRASAVTLTATTPGETSGPGIALSFEIDNGTADVVDLSSASVTVLYKAGKEIAIPATAAPYAPFSGLVKAGEKTSAVYVYLLPKAAQATALEATVTCAPGEPVALFKETAK